MQNNGFAIRRGLAFQCGPELTELSLHDDVRRGVELRMFPGTPRELRLLSVHLKSGCSRDSLDAARANCRVLAAQVPVLERWIDTQAAANMPFAVLGDFNRDLRREPAGVSLWAEIDDADPLARTWSIPLRDKDFRIAALARLSAATSTTSFWGGNWRGDWSRTPSDASFSGQKTPCAASCQITARYLFAFGWQTPPRPCRKPEEVNFFAKPIKFSSDQSPISQGNNP